jgi:hypothetical protein
MKLLDLVRTLASTEATVLIDDETRTDKKVLGALFFFAANAEIQPS